MCENNQNKARVNLLVHDALALFKPQILLEFGVSLDWTEYRVLKIVTN